MRVKFKEYPFVFRSAISVVNAYRGGDNDVPVRIAGCHTVAEGAGFHVLSIALCTKQMQFFVEEEYQKAVPIIFEKVACHEKMMVEGLDDTGCFAMGVRSFIMEFVVCAVRPDTHQQKLGMCWIGAFFSDQKGDALVVHYAVIEMDPAMREAIPVVDGPALGEQWATQETQYDGEMVLVNHVDGGWRA